MLVRIDGEGAVNSVQTHELAELGLRERDDLQEWVIEEPRILGEELLVITSEYAGFENTPAAAGEYRNPKRDVPFAMLTMITIITLTYVAVQAVALGTLPELATTESPLAAAAGQFAGPAALLLLSLGAVVSIFGNLGNTTLIGPRYAYALADDGYGPR